MMGLLQHHLPSPGPLPGVTTGLPGEPGSMPSSPTGAFPPIWRSLTSSRKRWRNGTWTSGYHWPIEADTHQLGNDDWVKAYFYRTMREIHWDLGFTDIAEQAFDEFLTYWQFQ
jgi:hypothetical protein